MGVSRGNHSKTQGCGTAELCPGVESKVMQVTWAERAHREGVPGSDGSPTSVPSSAIQLSAPCWREPLQSTATKEDAWIAVWQGVMESKSQTSDCFPVALFCLSRKACTALQ